MTYTCKITSKHFSKQNLIEIPDFAGVCYKVPKYGKIKISNVADGMLDNKLKNIRKRDILRGMIRNHNILEDDIFYINSTLLENLNEPEELNTYESRVIHLLRYIDEKGGDLRTPFDLNSMADFVITFSNNASEFERICYDLHYSGLIKVSNYDSESFPKIALKVEIRKEGKQKLDSNYNLSILEKLTRDVYTGDRAIDDKLIHAQELFYQNVDIEKKRSACKTLSDILEPIREEMKTKYFFRKDVQTFFDIINNFDIRHNKMSTKEIKYEEQFDWIFYSLLNSIITYYKMINKYE